MKNADIMEAFVSAIEDKIVKEWKHEGFIFGWSSEHIKFEIDGKEYAVYLEKLKEGQKIQNFRESVGEGVMRDRLIELLADVGLCHYESIADYLLANGVIVPPCKVGDKVYYPNNDTRTVYETKVYCICKDDEGGFIINPREYPRDAKTLYGVEFGETVFLSKEEAEKDFGGDG
jgi:hypothetical protein